MKHLSQLINTNSSIQRRRKRKNYNISKKKTESSFVDMHK